MSHPSSVGSALGIIYLGVVVALVGCGSGSPEQTGTTTSGEAAGPQRVDAAAPGRVDMNAIFPDGPGREIVLNNCQSCHTWVPIVVLQMNQAQWDRSSVEHRARVQGLSDEEFEVLYDYLAANFNPERPVPELPPALLESWTTY